MFDELLTSFDMRRMHLPATRIAVTVRNQSTSPSSQTRTTATSIDAVCTNLNPDETDVQIINTGISDHTAQLCRLKVPVSCANPTISTRRHLNTNNLLRLKQTLSDQSWEDVLSSDNVEEAYNLFSDSVSLALESNCPRKKTRRHTNSRKIIYDSEARDLKENYLTANNLYMWTTDVRDKQLANNLKKSYDLKLRNLRRDHSSGHIISSDNKSKAVWDIINSERKMKKENNESCLSLSVNGVKVEDPLKVADYFNEYFTTIADETLRLNPPRCPLPKEINEHVNLTELKELPMVTDYEMKKIIGSLKTKTSTGLDEISTKIVKFCSEELRTPLLHISNLSLHKGIFPQKMKVAKVIPLHKRGKKDDMRNYRPISLPPTFSKVIERAVLARLFHHLVENRLLTDSQHGFVKGKSTVTALVDLVEHLTDRIEDGSNVTSFFLDLSKAFDCLDHDLILLKLSSLGIKETALKWFSSYLTNRYQIVEVQHVAKSEINCIRSSQRPISRGVPQGSVLGPVIFILFTNDLPSHISPYGSSFMYADDTVIVSAGKCLESVEVDSFIALNNALEYCHNNDLVFNEDKTKQIMFGRHKDDIGGLPNLQTHNSTLHLGLVIDNGLTWREHVDSLCHRLNSAIFAIRRTAAIGTPEAVLVAYHALFESSMRYGIVLWGGSSIYNLERVLILQKRALRIVAGLEARESCRRVFPDKNILTVVSLFIYEAVLLSVGKRLPRNANVHGRNTRFAHNYNLPYHRTKLYEKKPSYLGAKFFNALPEKLKELPKIENLKTPLRTWLSARPFYTVAEFLDWGDFDLNDY